VKKVSKLHRIVWDTVYYLGFASFGGSTWFLLSGEPPNHLGFIICCTIGMFCFVGLGIWVGVDMKLKGELRPFGRRKDDDKG